MGLETPLLCPFILLPVNPNERERERGGGEERRGGTSIDQSATQYRR